MRKHGKVGFFLTLMYCWTNIAVAQVDPAVCELDIGASIPAFQCSDGILVNDYPDAMDKCDKPEHLGSRCVNYSWLGSLSTSNPDVDTIFSCRPEISDVTKTSTICVEVV